MLPSSALSDDVAVRFKDECSRPWGFPRVTQSGSTKIKKSRKSESTVLRKCKRISTVGRLYHHSIILTRCVGSLGAIEGHGKSGGTKLR